MEIKLTELFEVQRKLDVEIERKHPSVDGEDRFSKRILALLVELGECANEWRGFKFWSTNQQPRKCKANQCPSCLGNGVHLDRGAMSFWDCEECDTFGYIEIESNPLLEEYVDCLHFILSIGNALDADIPFVENHLKDFSKWESAEKQLNSIFYYASCFHFSYNRQQRDACYTNLFVNFVGLGEMLGFTWQQIETAYMSKNATNWERQANGY